MCVFEYFLTNHFDLLIQLSENYNKIKYTQDEYYSIKRLYESIKLRDKIDTKLFLNIDGMIELFQESKSKLSSGMINALLTMLLFQNPESIKHDYFNFAVNKIISSWDLINQYGYRILPLTNVVKHVENLKIKN